MNTQRLWVVVPAAGTGRRMTRDIPKQYLPLLGRTVIEWSVDVFLKRADVAGVAVVLAAGDNRFATLALSRDVRIRTAVGGAERSESVLAGLKALQRSFPADTHAADRGDWVLVHDAARPCLCEEDLQLLISAVQTDEVGGLLAAPVTDTLKSGDASHRVMATPSRENVWRALTPQMFRIGELQRALTEHAGQSFTDDSSAMEMLGRRPKLVAGRTDNIKITRPSDLQEAELILRNRARTE